MVLNCRTSFDVWLYVNDLVVQFDGADWRPDFGIKYPS